MNNFLTNDLKFFAQHLNILIVEDEIELANELKELLAIFFNNVYVARDGEEGLKLYKKFKCDIVITDLNMPKKNGLELSREIRILNKDQIIVVLSGYIDTFVVELIDIGIQTLIIKPYNLDNFLQKLLIHCENLIMKKEFEKIKLNSVLSFNKNFSSDFQEVKIKNETNTSINHIMEKYVETKNPNESIDNYISTFNVKDNVDLVMWKHISEDIQELNEIFEDNINRIVLNGLNNEIKYDLILIFEKYNSSLLLIPGLEKFAKIFSDLADILYEINLEKSTTNYILIFDIFEYFYEDIIKFFNIVFVDQSSSNLNYLTDSMDSSVIQLKTYLGLIDLKEEELEFF